MTILKNLALPLTALSIIAFGWVLGQSASNKKLKPATYLSSPWDGLSGAEYRQAAKLLKQLHGDDVLFAASACASPIRLKPWRGKKARAFSAMPK